MNEFYDEIVDGVMVGVSKCVYVGAEDADADGKLIGAIPDDASFVFFVDCLALHEFPPMPDTVDHVSVVNVGITNLNNLPRNLRHLHCRRCPFLVELVVPNGTTQMELEDVPSLRRFPDFPESLYDVTLKGIPDAVCVPEMPHVGILGLMDLNIFLRATLHNGIAILRVCMNVSDVHVAKSMMRMMTRNVFAETCLVYKPGVLRNWSVRALIRRAIARTVAVWAAESVRIEHARYARLFSSDLMRMLSDHF